MNRIKYLSRWLFRKTKRSKFIIEGWNSKVLHLLSILIPFLLLVSFGIIVFEFGYKSFWSNHPKINFWLTITIACSALLLSTRILMELFIYKKKWVRIFNISGVVFLFFLSFLIIPIKASLNSTSSNLFLFNKIVIYGGVALAFITEISNFLQFIYSRKMNSGILFVGSFAFLILMGSFLLKLPNATYQGISSLDALFTSASAVCVTGLIVVDTATHFTSIGKLIILLLIQLGGLGIMTFAGLLAYAVAGQTSLKTQLAFKDMMSSSRINNVIYFVYQVVIVTFLFELIGAVFIYLSVDDNLFDRHLDKIFFSANRSAELASG
jgi:hypothetical protein